MTKINVTYEIWQCRCDVPSEWDGGAGRLVETVEGIEKATEAVKRYQAGGHAAWVVRNYEMEDGVWPS